MKTAIAGILVLAATAQAAEAQRLELRFIGNMAFAVTDGKTTLYTDFPYESGAFGYMTYDFASVPKAASSLCLITHGHRDHFDPALFAKMESKIIAPPSLAATLPAGRVIPFAPEMSYRVIVIEAFRTPHGDMDHASYLVTWHGLRLYFTGDTDSLDQLLAMRGLDAAFVSPWLIEMVAQRKGRIDTRLLVSYHHTTGEKVAALQDRIVPKQGETLTLEASRSGAPR